MATVLVLGASRGIGFEFVKQYLAQGDTVYATARDAESATRLANLGAHVMTLDVSKPDSMQQLAEQLAGHKFHLAIYNAGTYTEAGATLAPEPALFDTVMHTNVLGAMQAITHFAPTVQEVQGKFVFITSGMGSISDCGSSFGWVYRVSKAALNMAVASARFDYPQAAMVVMNPGWVRTDMGGANATLSVEESVTQMRRAITHVELRDSGQFVNYDGRRWAW